VKWATSLKASTVFEVIAVYLVYLAFLALLVFVDYPVYLVLADKRDNLVLSDFLVHPAMLDQMVYLDPKDY